MQPVNLSPEPAVNLPELLVRVDNDYELLCELIDIFKVALPGYLRALREAVAQMDLRSVEKTAHALKGMLLNLAATRAAATAAQLEHVTRPEDPGVLSGALAELEGEIAALTLELDALKAKLRP